MKQTYVEFTVDVYLKLLKIYDYQMKHALGSCESYAHFWKTGILNRLNKMIPDPKSETDFIREHTSAWNAWWDRRKKHK